MTFLISVKIIGSFGLWGSTVLIIISIKGEEATEMFFQGTCKHHRIVNVAHFDSIVLLWVGPSHDAWQPLAVRQSQPVSINQDLLFSEKLRQYTFVHAEFG